MKNHVNSNCCLLTGDWSDCSVMIAAITDYMRARRRIALRRNSQSLLGPGITYPHHKRTIIIIIKKEWHCKAGRGRLTPYQSEDPSPTLPSYIGK